MGIDGFAHFKMGQCVTEGAMKTKAVMVCGSRSVSVGARQKISQVVSGLLAEGRVLVVGCATGADEAALSAALSAGCVSQVRVFAAFGPGGAGACRWSAVSTVSRFVAAGGRVAWWAGGGSKVPLSVRLPLRTRVAVEASSCLVAFFSVPGSRGSRLACRSAVRGGLPVAALPFGFPGARLPTLGAGEWRPSGKAGVWADAWRWVPGQECLF